MSLVKTVQSKLTRILTYNLDYPDWSKAPAGLLLRNLFLLIVIMSLSAKEMFANDRIKPYPILVESLLFIITIRHFLFWCRAKSRSVE